MPIKLINVNIMSQLTSRGLDNTSSAFVSDIYIYRDDSKMTKIGHFATTFLTKPKEMGTIWTSSFEDKSLNFIAGYL